MTGHLMNCAGNDRAMIKQVIAKKSFFISISLSSGYYIQYIVQISAIFNFETNLQLIMSSNLTISIIALG